MSADDDRDKRAAFEATALPHLDQLQRTAGYLCRDPSQAADLVQDTVVRAYRFWHQFEAGTNCRSWLLTILHNTFRNHYRAEKRRPGGVEFDEATHGPTEPARVHAADPATLVGERGFDDEVEAALQGLPPDFLEVVVLIDLQDLTYEEAAEVIGRPVGTVRSRLSRGRQQLAEKLEIYAERRGLRK